MEISLFVIFHRCSAIDFILFYNNITPSELEQWTLFFFTIISLLRSYKFNLLLFLPFSYSPFSIFLFIIFLFSALLFHYFVCALSFQHVLSWNHYFTIILFFAFLFHYFAFSLFHYLVSVP
jgi:hypothetical protein